MRWRRKWPADAPRWKARFPQIRVFCPGAARVKVEQVVAVDGDLGDLPPDPRVSFETLDGTRGDEPVFIVRGNGDEPARTLIFTDALFNHSHAQGFGGAIMRWMGSTGGPKVTPLFRMAGISDKEAFFEHLARLAGVEGPTRILVAHGDPITADAPGVLTRAAGA